MPERIVLAFPTRSRTASPTYVTHDAGPAQLDLFAGIFSNTPSIVFIDLDGLNQEILLASLVRYSIGTVVDLRGKPVFPKPRFDHKFLMAYFFSRSIDYVEAALSGLPPSGRRTLSPERDGPFERWLSGAFKPQPTVCIIDPLALENGVVSTLRQQLAARTDRPVEIHPRSLT